ncbi:MAG: single-stranded DNA-binding protein [Bacteroidia bacterium]
MAKFGLNRVVLVGNLGKDPEMRYVNQEIPLALLRMAVSEPDANGQVSTTWVNVSLWRKQAEVAHRYARKGSTVLVEGKLVEKKWESSQGEQKSRLEVEGERFVLLDKAPDRTDSATDMSQSPLGKIDPLASLESAKGVDDLPF